MVTTSGIRKPITSGLTSSPSFTRGRKSRFLHWAGIEEDAVTLYAYECRVVPGLLQPESYIRAVCNSRLPPLSDEQIESQVAARLDRQRLLNERPNTEFGFIIEQAVFERQTGGTETTRCLLGHLIERAELRNVEVQIMPLRRPDHVGLDGPLYLAETQDRRWIGYFEGHDHSAFCSRPDQVSSLLRRYGRMRSQALSPEASVDLPEHMREALSLRSVCTGSRAATAAPAAATA
ncbi:DUF5753 domain-containing protein [Yinghuangia sp. YIM S10712]|uniref:DUF5753 domain-containing protein n=1 Tax=Yinghuangia sp. YIM S10712 TaxID=3436930 RepID=UPI003F52DFC6